MSQESYRKLAEHLDRLPGGFAPSETCLERCQMEALRAEDDRVALDADRCIGCGLCVSTCPSGALTLQRKPGSREVRLPPDLSTAWREIAREQARRAGG